MSKKSLLILSLSLALFPLTASAQWAGRQASAPQTAAAPVMAPQAQRPPSSAPTGDASIAAVVNEAVISTSDVQARVSLALLSSGMPDTPDIRAKILPQVLRNLIDEQLQLEQGKKLGLSVSAEEIHQALQGMTKQNDIPGGDIDVFLKQNHVSPLTLHNQVRATLTWNKVVMNELRPRIDVGDDEVQAAHDRMIANAGKQEFLVSEIFLAVDNPRDDAQVAAFANQLAAQIRQGANFGAIARQFSQGTGAANGGDIGWVQDGQLPSELTRALLATHEGQITSPIRSSNGYHILGVRDTRTVASADIKDAIFNLQQAFIPFTNGITKDKALEESERLRQKAHGCTGLQSLVEKNFSTWHWSDLGDIAPSSAPSWMTDVVGKIGVGQSTMPIATDKAALVLFLCRRDTKASVNRDEIVNTIGSERLELLARRELRDLRRAAFIDVRSHEAP